MRIFVLVLFLLASCSAPRRVVSVLDEPIQSAPPKKGSKGLIIIDPGHGGEDQGTKSLIKPIYLEKHLNLMTAKFLVAYLEQMGYRTLMTRIDDTFIPLKARAEFANERHARLFVSVHYNAAPSSEAKGIEVFYYPSDKNLERTKASKSLAAAILRHVLTLTHAPSRGVKAGDFAVIRETQMPAVLVEGGFLTNTQEFQQLKDPAYLKKVAWGIAQGIHQYVLGAS